MKRRCVCLHGHFYQPPRENPWLETIERQDSAYPYHDWNERVTAECYAPNAASRILDGDGRIVEIVNNYSRISFNFGPTLLSWLEENSPFTYEAVLEADRRSRERFGGHGSALAQAHGHVIMPLAHSRDKRTQVLWGLRDFRHRFGRDAEGMWLPETAVDLESLDVMAEHGVSFTVLAPHQAEAVRPLPPPGGEEAGEEARGGPDDGEDTAGEGEWREVGGDVDPTRPYRVRLPSGRTITVFFYDGPISRAVAFEELLASGDRFADRLLDALPESPDEGRLSHVATDGETYGHHHTHGETALSYALARIEAMDDVQLTNYGEFLEAHPPRHEARIREGTSWSCSHGVERWRSDCGCSTGAPEGWNQAWRRPLREALDWLRGELADGYEERARELLDDPWAARDDYVRVVLDRSPDSVDAFLSEHASGEPDERARVRTLKLLEIQRHAMLMFTSCGWFFADLSGIETVQVLLYAGRAVQLAEDVLGDGLEEGFLERLEDARSNLPEKGNGREVYRASVGRARVDLPNVAAHWALRSLFDRAEDGAETEDGNPGDGGEEGASGADGAIEVYCYRVEPGDDRSLEMGRSKLKVGWATFRSAITGESARLTYAAFHVGDHNLVGGVRGFQGSEDYRAVQREAEEAFTGGKLPELVRIVDRKFRTPTYSLGSVFRDEQQEIVEQIFESSVRDAEAVLSTLYRERAPLMRFVAELGISQPRVFRLAAEYVLDAGLREALEGEEPDLDRAEELLDEARESNVGLDPTEIGYASRRALETLADRLAEEPTDLERLRRLERGLDLLLGLDVDLSLWSVQNTFYGVLRDLWQERAARAEDGHGEAARWVEHVRRTGEKLSVAVP